MADATFKTSSGDDLILSNDDGSKKIEVPESGDVEVTGDLKTTTVKATNIKANDGTAGLSIADSTGRVTFTETNPVITLGSNATFPSGTLVKSEFYIYSSTDYSTASETLTAVENYEDFSCTVGNTIFFTFKFQAETFGNGQDLATRRGLVSVYQSTSSVSSGATSSLGTILQTRTLGRDMGAASSNSADLAQDVAIPGVFVATNTTHYLGLTGRSLNDTTTTFRIKRAGERNLILSIYEFKGDVLT